MSARCLNRGSRWGSGAVFVALSLAGGVTFGAEKAVPPRERVAIDAAAFPLKLSSRQTWLSQGQPEWHLLLENPTDQPITFELEHLPKGRVAFNECVRAHNVATENVSIDRQLVAGDELTTLWGGEIPAHGWSHRAVVLGGGRRAAGCSVVFEVTAIGAGETRVSRKLVVTVGASPSRNEQPSVGYANRNLGKPPTVEHNVELVGWSKRTQPNIQTLVRNEGQETLDVQAVLGGFECQPGVQASLPAARDVRYPDRLYTGPVRLRAGEWMAFKRRFSKSPADGSKTCWAKMIVEASNLDHSASSENVAEVRF